MFHVYSLAPVRTETVYSPAFFKLIIQYYKCKAILLPGI